jgi:6-phosphofructokinase 1
MGQLLDRLKQNHIRYFFYIGGNDSMDTVEKLSAYAQAQGYDMRVVGVPKTIDNDLMGTDHTPGYGSAAKYIAVTMGEILRDAAVYTLPAVTVVEIMGRDAGWLTAAASLGRLVSGQEPDLVYLPERIFDLEAFYEDVAAALARHPSVVVAVSEGLRCADGSYVGACAQSGSVDAFGHQYLAGTGKALELAIRERFGCKVRSVELNLPQRCAAHLLSAQDVEESLAVGAGAVSAAVAGVSQAMMTIQRTEGEEYGYAIGKEPIASIANRTRRVPDAFITPRGNQVTDDCLRYLLPLIQGERYPVYDRGMPRQYIFQ